MDQGLFPSIVTDPDYPIRVKLIECSTNSALYEFAAKWAQSNPSDEPIARLMSHSMSLYNSPPLDTIEYNRTAVGTLPYGATSVSKSDSSGDIKLFCEGLKSLLETTYPSRFNIRTSSRISSISTSEGAVKHLEMSDGSIMSADRYIVAAGTSSRDLLSTAGVSCPTVAVKGYILTFNSSTKIEYNMATRNKTFVSPINIDEKNEVYQYRASGFAEFGAEQTDWEGQENKTMSSDDLSALKTIREIMEEKFDDVEVTDEDYGFRCLAPDDRPLIGSTSVKNLYVNTGSGSKGWTMGAGGGDLPTSATAVQHSVTTWISANLKTNIPITTSVALFITSGPHKVVTLIKRSNQVWAKPLKRVNNWSISCRQILILVWKPTWTLSIYR